MEEPVIISNLNDFIFCPISIYFHNLLFELDTALYHARPQIEGKAAHLAIDENRYAKGNTLKAISVYSEKFNFVGKIDIYETDTKTLIERKYMLSQIYDGQVFQLYAQCIAMREMGYEVRQLKFHSMKDNKTYNVSLPEDDPEMMEKFEKLFFDIKSFDPAAFVPKSKPKCSNCIYRIICDRSLADDE